MTLSIFAASATVRQIGPVRMFSPAPIIPLWLTSSIVGASPTRLFTDAGQRIFRKICFADDDGAGIAQPFDESGIGRRTVVGIVRIGAGSRAKVERIVLIFDCHDDTVEGADE